MENLLLYFVKVSGLLIIFYLTYALLLQKETFFTANRWFLIGGLFTSLLLPFYFFEKVVFVATPKNTFQDVIVMGKNTVAATNHFTPENQINWFFIFICSYLIVAAFLGFKIIAEVVSLFHILNKKDVVKEDKLAIVDLNKDIAPFSFFNYIVYNSRLYSDNELQNILSHERIHSQEKHSFDILISKIFCVVFWFNPFVWLYKKALIQNLEYIADQKAIQNTNDKKAYQITLLKVVSNQNCFTITNSFYQSLIKKRIVMLNKTQSKKWNSWKYALIIPSLVAFVILFQVKVIAQEKLIKLEDGSLVSSTTRRVTELLITKNATDAELKKDCENLKKEFNVDLKVTNIKRNSKNEITSISIKADDNKGSQTSHDIDSDQPITPFVFTIKKYSNDNGKVEFGFFDENVAPEVTETDATTYYNSDEDQAPVAPVPPVPPAMTAPYSKMPTPPAPPRFPTAPRVKAPKDPNDTKAWRKFEEEMEAFAKKWENSADMKKFEAEMKVFEAKMQDLQPDMTAFDQEMKKFEMKMDKFEQEMEIYQEKMMEKNEDRQEQMRERIEQRREAQKDKLSAEKVKALAEEVALKEMERSTRIIEASKAADTKSKKK